MDLQISTVYQMVRHRMCVSIYLHLILNFFGLTHDDDRAAKRQSDWLVKFSHKNLN